METKVSDFHTSFYISAIQKLAFHIPHVRILCTNHCGEMRRTAFKRRELFQGVLCCRGRDGVVEFISVYGAAMKCSNVIPSIDTYLFPPYYPDWVLLAKLATTLSA